MICLPWKLNTIACVVCAARLTVPTGTYPRTESSFGFVFLNFLLPLVPLWLNVQLSSFQHPSWSDEFPFPELRFPKEIQKSVLGILGWKGNHLNCFISDLLTPWYYLHDAIYYFRELRTTFNNRMCKKVTYRLRCTVS